MTESLQELEGRELTLQTELNFHKGKVHQMQRELRVTEAEIDAKLFREGCLANIRTLKFTLMDFLYLLVSCLGNNRAETISLCANYDGYPPSLELEKILISETSITAYKKIRKWVDGIYQDAYARVKESEQESTRKDADMKFSTNEILKKKSRKFKRTLTDAELESMEVGA